MPRPIAAELVDDAGQPQVRSRVQNTLTLRVSSLTGAVLTSALIHISLAPLFADPDEQADLVVHAPGGWTAGYEPPIQAWALRAPAPLSMLRGEVIAVTFGGVQPDIPVGEVLVPVVVTDGEQAGTRVTVSLLVLPPTRPDRDLREALGARMGTRQPGHGVGSPEVTVSRRMDEVERSHLVLTLYNRTGAPLVAGEWGPWPPTLTLVFDTADGPPGHYALTTASRLDDIEVIVERGTGWRVVKRSPGPEWDLVAVPVGGRRDVLAPGAFVELSIRGVTTDFAPGPTLAELRSHGFPGFADGVRTFVVDKRCPPMKIIEPLEVDEDAVQLSPAGTATVELSWEVEHSSLVQLSGVGEVPSKSTGHVVEITRDTVFVLTAYDAMLGEVLTERIAVAATAPATELISTALLPRGAILAWRGGPVPEGFALCDGGVEGVPDLRGRFILGAGEAADGSNASPGDRGGGEPHSHAFVDTTVTATVVAGGEHEHPPPQAWSEVILQPGFKFRRVPALTLPAQDLGRVASSRQPGHEHALDPLVLNLAAGTGEPPAPRPPWFALAYIIKL